MSKRRDFGFLRRAAQRAAARPFFVARDLAAYMELHQVGEEALADLLGCSPEQLPRLALCRRPDPAGADFRSEVERIAQHVGARAERLAQLLREVDVVRTLRRAGPQQDRCDDRGMLLAARDRGASAAPEAGPTEPGASGAPTEDAAAPGAEGGPPEQQ
ncbi:MAG: hypothetical protein HY689_05405 [Chloroflexi bacterium]|nr:hypothetical protein [Chloroflexota bacterium]